MRQIALATLCTFVALTSALARCADSTLTIVRDVGGVSALPYYEGLHLRAQREESRPPSVARRMPPLEHFTEGALLPVVSRSLSPGKVAPRPLHAPGLTPLFLIGEDAQSRTWLREHAQELRTLHASGLVVNVASADALSSLRAVAPGLTLAPTCGDDLAQRLKLQHYPVLITATAIRQ